MFLYKHNDRCATSMTERRLISVRSSSSIWIINSQTDGLVVAVHTIGLTTTFTGYEPIRLPLRGYMKTVVHEHKANTRKELLQRKLSAARSINNATALRKITGSLVTQVRKCIKADGGHFEQLAWVLNGESVTVHLTTYLNKYTMFLFHI